jgi:hypothetical protein
MTVSRELERLQNILSQYLPVQTKENHEGCQDDRSPDRDSNPGPPEYKAEKAINTPRRSAGL